MALSLPRLLATGTMLAVTTGPLALPLRSGGVDPTERAYATSRFLDLRGVRTHVQVWEPADGIEPTATIVALHHFHGTAQTFDRVGTRLADQGIRLVAFDRVGFGLTDRPDPEGRWTGPDAPYTRAFAVEQVLELFDHFGVERGIVTGTSMGGTVTLELALAHPDRLAAIVPVASALTGDASAPARLRPALRNRWASGLGSWYVRRQAGGISLDRVAGAWKDPDQATQDDLVAHSRGIGVDGWDAGLWWKVISDEPPALRDSIAAIADSDLEVVAVAGDADPLISPAVMRHVADLTGGRLEVLDCGHVVQSECPDELAAILAQVAADAAAPR